MLQKKLPASNRFAAPPTGKGQPSVSAVRIQETSLAES
jgi:hypothetical protein